MDRENAGSSKASTEARLKLFIAAYVENGGNGTQAAITAGYSPKSARRTATWLTSKPHIAARIKELLDAQVAKAEEGSGIKVRDVLNELRNMVHSNPKRVFDEHGNVKEMCELADEDAKAIASIEVVEQFQGTGKDKEFVGYTKKLKFWDKNSAVEKAMKHLGLFREDNKQLAPVLPPIITVIGVRAKG